MAISVTVSNEQAPADREFEIVGLGAFKNGETREITEEQERAFVSLYQMSVADAIGEQDAVKVSGTSTLDNIDDVLGVDVSDTLPPPDLEAITAANQDAAANEEASTTAEDTHVELPTSITNAGGDS
jgi:hypothetical protein